LRDALPAIRAKGAELVIIGNGRPEHAAEFRDMQHVESPLLVDPKLQAYQAAGLKRGVLRTLGPTSLRNGWRAFKAGQRQGWTQGDPWQEGGVFVIRPDESVAFSYVSESAGDHPETSAVLAAL